MIGVHVAKSTILGGARNGGNLKSSAKIYRAFSIFAVHALHTVFECEESFYFVAVLVPICSKGASLQLIFHQQLSLVPTVSTFCSLNGNIKSSS